MVLYSGPFHFPNPDSALKIPCLNPLYGLFNPLDNSVGWTVIVCADKDEAQNKIKLKSKNNEVLKLLIVQIIIFDCYYYRFLYLINTTSSAGISKMNEPASSMDFLPQMS